MKILSKFHADFAYNTVEHATNNNKSYAKRNVD